MEPADWIESSWCYNGALKNTAGNGTGTPRLAGVYGFNSAQSTTDKTNRWANGCVTLVDELPLIGSSLDYKDNCVGLVGVGVRNDPLWDRNDLGAGNPKLAGDDRAA